MLLTYFASQLCDASEFVLFSFNFISLNVPGSVNSISSGSNDGLSPGNQYGAGWADKAAFIPDLRVSGFFSFIIVRLW